MKKVFISFAILLSSLFFFNLKVEAQEYNYDVDLSVFNETFYKVKDAADSYLETITEDTYIIFYENNLYYVSFITSDKLSSKEYCVANDSSGIYFYSSSSSLKRFKYDTSTNTLVNNGSFSSNYIFLYKKVNILYSNSDILYRNGTSITLTLNYDGYSIVHTTDTSFSTLYHTLKKYQELSGSNSHEEEVSILNSFYSLCVSKLSFLAESIASNYIYLTMIVIVIVIFLFELIRRRFL